MSRHLDAKLYPPYTAFPGPPSPQPDKYNRIHKMESNVDFIKGLLEEALEHTDTQGCTTEEMAEAASELEALLSHAVRILSDTQDLARPPSASMDTDE